MLRSEHEEDFSNASVNMRNIASQKYYLHVSLNALIKHQQDFIKDNFKYSMILPVQQVFDRNSMILFFF